MRYLALLIFLAISQFGLSQKTLRPNFNPDAVMLKKWIKNDTLYLECDCYIVDLAMRNKKFRLFHNVSGKATKVPIDQLPAGRTYVVVAIKSRYIAFNIETREEIKI